MDRVVRAFPLLNGKRTALQAFIQSLDERPNEVEAFYRKYGIVRESWHLQRSPAGDLVVCCTDIVDVGAAVPYGASQEPFEAWFKEQVLEICGVDANSQPLGPDCQTVFDWKAR